jgi:hypothetical protein
MNDELKGIEKEAVMTDFKNYTISPLDGLRRTAKNVRIVCVPAQIQIRHLLIQVRNVIARATEPPTPIKMPSILSFEIVSCL